MRWILSAAFCCVLAGALSCSDMTAPAPISNLDEVKWFYSSTPVTYLDGSAGTPVPIGLNDTDRGELLWFSPDNVQVRDLTPSVISSDRYARVDALEVIYIPPDSAEVKRSWGGLVSSFGQEGLHISSWGYLEVWLNDYIPYERSAERRGELYIDVGQMTEDAVWDSQTPPLPRNERLDFEDQNLNGGRPEVVEDLGLDSTASSGTFVYFEPQLRYEKRRPGTKTFSVFTPTQDPAGDDRAPTPDENAPENTIAERIDKYRGMNGTEKNDRLDSEDLNGNYQLDQEDRYFEYRIALADSAFIDNRRDFPVANQKPQSGWRMYRIPLTRFDQEIGGAPSFIQGLRMWFRGIAPGDTLDVQVGRLEIVGSN